MVSTVYGKKTNRFLSIHKIPKFRIENSIPLKKLNKNILYPQGKPPKDTALFLL